MLKMILIEMEIYFLIQLADRNESVLTPKQNLTDRRTHLHLHHVALASCCFPAEAPGKFVEVKRQIIAANHSEEGRIAWKYCFLFEHSSEANRENRLQSSKEFVLPLYITKGLTAR